MKPEYTVETAKDPSGARVIEAFLASNAASKQKRRLIIKYALLGYVLCFMLQAIVTYSDDVSFHL